MLASFGKDLTSESIDGVVCNKKISVIIPALNEARNIRTTLASIDHVSGVESIVVDGGSTDRTAELARSGNARVVTSLPGRARQLNAGARAARGDVFLFLHADSQLPKIFHRYVLSLLNQSEVVAGAFRLAVDSDLPGVRLVENVANWRSRFLQMPYGDQGIFVKASTFWQIGGFPDQPIMEDFEFIRRVRKEGRIAIAPASIITSDRRWRRLGVVRTTLVNQWVIIAFYLGIDPHRLAQWYR